MTKFKVVCVDMFQTLVDVNTRIPVIWSKILKERYTEDIAFKFGAELQSYFIEHFYKKSKSHGFETIQSMFINSFDKVFKNKNIIFSAKEAAEIITKEHGFSKPYYDTDIFFELVTDFPVCLISDADFEMINPLIEKYDFDNVFISEQFKSYKSSPENNIFKKVLEKYNIEAEEILHIGDGYSDIFGAKQVGIQTCWINREKKEWENDIKPDYIIHSLKEVKEILRL